MNLNANFQIQIIFRDRSTKAELLKPDSKEKYFYQKEN